MKVYELIEFLQEQNPGADVRIATQPSWPLAFDISHVACQVEWDEESDTVWIATGEHPDDNPYAPGEAFGNVW